MSEMLEVIIGQIGSVGVGFTEDKKALSVAAIIGMQPHTARLSMEQADNLAAVLRSYTKKLKARQPQPSARGTEEA